MFKEIVSQLSFSPATISRLSEYAKNVQKQQRISGWASFVLLFCILIHVIIVLFPPAVPLSSSKNDILPDGVYSTAELLEAYDTNKNSFKDILTGLGITKSNLQDAHYTEEATDLNFITGLTPYGVANEQRFEADGFTHPFFVRPLLKEQENHPGWTGSTASGNRFQVFKDNGTVALASLPALSPKKSSFDYTQAVTSSGDTLTWKLTVANNSTKSVTEGLVFSTADIEEYATINSIPNGSFFSDDQQQIVWPALTLDANEKREFTVIARVVKPVNTTPRSAINPFSFDCRITTVFGDTPNTIEVACPLTKRIEVFLSSVTPTHQAVPLIIYSGLFVISLVSYFRFRLIAREIRIIRTQVNTGGLL